MDWIYKERERFCIIALTGPTGSGCSEFASIMGDDDLMKTESIRKIDEINSNIDEKDLLMKKNAEIFKRKYQICYNYCNSNIKPFKVIKYKNILMLFTLKYFIEEAIKCKCEIRNYVIEKLNKILTAKFKKSDELDSDYDFDDDLNKVFVGLKSIIKTDLFNNINVCYFDNDENVYDFFYSEQFVVFCDEFYNLLKSKDYYIKNFFVHRLANVIRATGNPNSNIKVVTIGDEKNMK